MIVAVATLEGVDPVPEGLATVTVEVRARGAVTRPAGEPLIDSLLRTCQARLRGRFVRIDIIVYLGTCILKQDEVRPQCPLHYI